MQAMRYVLGNWKMNLGGKAAREYAEQLTAITVPTGLRVGICPPATALSLVAEIVSSQAIEVGAQNVHWAPSGAFTGELSPAFLTDLGISFALTGHSERRHGFGENSALVAKRCAGASAAGLDVVVCIGETKEERERSATLDVLAEQLDPVMRAVEAAHRHRIILAYEPVWAIGTGIVATAEDIAAAHRFIRDFCSDRWAANIPPILYGGSVTAENFREILQVPNVAGGLIGGASLKFDQFMKLISIAGAA
jgi:triosephosphate isomerase (TIM)